MIKDVKKALRQFFKSVFTGYVSFSDYQTFKEYRIQKSMNLMGRSNFDTPLKSAYMGGYIAATKEIFDDIERQIED